MLKNLILDMGNVMLEFTPDRFIEAIGITDPEERSLLHREVFQSLEWAQMDWGVLEEQQAAAQILPRLPEKLQEKARFLICSWDTLSRPVAGMAELVRECKAAGLGIYLLSNASCRLQDYWQKIPGHEFFDGITISAFLGMIKPNPEIYRYVLQTYGLKAEECLFVDDLPVNVAGALQAGMSGFIYRGDIQALRNEIASLRD